MELSKLPKVSIIVSVYNGQETIGKCLNSVLALDYPDFEVIVMDDASTDKTKYVLKYFVEKNASSRIHIEVFGLVKNVGQAKCRNEAVECVKGDYIAFVDADVIVDKNWLKELMSSPFLAGVGGKQLCPKDATPFQRILFKFIAKFGEYQGEEFKSVQHLPSCNVIYHKQLFQALGGFKDLRYGEDVDFNYRLTREWKLMYNPKAICYHYPPKTLKAFLKKMYHYGKAQGMLVRKYKIFRKIQIIPFITLGVLCTMILIILFTKKQ